MPIPPHLKFDEKGVVGEKGVKFSDRGLLGKLYNSRIITVKVWVEKTTFAICGLQVVYLLPHVNKTRLGGEHVKGKSDAVSEMKFECPPGDYVKSVSGSISTSNVIDYLVFISRESRIMRFGAVKPNQKQFTFDIEETELPVCLYGALEQRAERGLSALTFLGLEIARDEVPPPV
jgi:hypothetical protein